MDLYTFIKDQILNLLRFHDYNQGAKWVAKAYTPFPTSIKNPMNQNAKWAIDLKETFQNQVFNQLRFQDHNQNAV
jgi:hypothetical protein